MTDTIADLMKWIDEQRGDCVSKYMRMIRDDEPKNKFSVITGKITAYDEVQMKLQEIEKSKAHN